MGPPSAAPDLSLLEDAWDCHVHFGPELVSRAQDFLALAAAARAAGMAGLVLKDHTGSTLHASHAARAASGDTVRFPPSLTLNTTVGGLNPIAVDVALRSGVRVVWFPTFSAAHQVRAGGPMPYPAPAAPLTLHHSDGRVREEVIAILDLIARHDAVVATGHLSPEEGLALVRLGRERGVRRLVVTHASEPVTAMPLPLQRAAVAAGAWIEHCLLPTSPHFHPRVPAAEIRRQIVELASPRVLLTSDFGQVDNGPPVAAFAAGLAELLQTGLPREFVRTAITRNPAQLFEA